MKRNVDEYQAFRRGEIRMPSHLKPAREEKGKLYENIIMEKLTRAPIRVTQLMWLSIIALFIYGSFFRFRLYPTSAIPLFLTGALIWTFTEYIIHRFVYHTETNSDAFSKFQFTMHIIHHHYPKDPDRLAMPPLPGLILAALLLGIFYLLIGIYSFAFFPGFITGYLAYISLHYYEHRYKSPKYKPWQRLWLHHKSHHYSNPYRAFGVSTRLWDLVFGTLQIKSKKEEESSQAI